ncbi:MAG: hypothetical protein JRF45_03640 [Deltaproteobacteria bacterium]|nr:hypothetical protein [Deltaproteobacteria bacterium]MBW1746997.1 hypothetical protein [Deltaproteobacteria bacterium]MBW2197004.1 hypothetical protein [Deltaproteobacteria bacterium]MBW2325583.1 hypothetical protein [Deltaproteobacteria bacterium]MBW2556192.1 hypothetical protein [Deltaproteobacteria bacterium]
MAKLKIRIFKNNGTTPDTTATIPLAIVKVASKLIPRKAVTVLDDLGIDLDQLIEISKSEDALGTLAEIEEHKKNRKIVISVE